MRQLKVPEYEWSLISKLSKKTNPEELWSRTSGRPGNFKKSLTKKLLLEQDTRCAYCGSHLFEEHPHRDHIAPKELYPKLTFRPENLVLACFACNTDRKKSYDPIETRKSKYKKCKFRFIHPYFDNPDKHIVFMGDVGGVVISNKSNKGKETINLFDLDSPERTKQRAKDALFDESTSKLHGKWRLLFQATYYSGAGLKLVPR